MFHPVQNSGRDGKRFESCCAGKTGKTKTITRKPGKHMFAMLVAFPAVPCNSEVRFTRLKHPKARPCNFCKSHHIKSIIFPKI